MTEFTSKNLFLKESIDFGLPGPEHFEVKESRVDALTMADGDILVKIMAISADPYLRNSIKKTSGPMNAGANKQGGQR